MKLTSYRDARSLIQNGDLLLFRSRGLISIMGRGSYSHAAMVAWWGKELFCLEVRELYGGRAVLLSSQVARYPNRIDVYRPRTSLAPEFAVDNTVAYMKRLCGSQYGYFNVVMAALLHLPVIRLFIKPDTNDESISSRPPFCSHACALAYREGGGIDTVLNLADRLTEPCDLARSIFFKHEIAIGRV